jgi:hypothetical protein
MFAQTAIAHDKWPAKGGAEKSRGYIISGQVAVDSGGSASLAHSRSRFTETPVGGMKRIGLYTVVSAC